MEESEKPPVFGSWKRWYWFILSALVVEMIIFYWITRSFA